MEFIKGNKKVMYAFYGFAVGCVVGYSSVNYQREQVNDKNIAARDEYHAEMIKLQETRKRLEDRLAN